MIFMCGFLQFLWVHQLYIQLNRPRFFSEEVKKIMVINSQPVDQIWPANLSKNLRQKIVIYVSFYLSVQAQRCPENSGPPTNLVLETNKRQLKIMMDHTVEQW